MLKLVVAVSLFVAATSHSVVIDSEWNDFKQKHGKTYEGDEDAKRFEIYSDTKRFIVEHNEKFRNGDKTFSVGINKFSDWTPQEMGKLNGFLASSSRNGSTFLPPFHVQCPDSIDWRDHGYVTPVQFQGCGDCWAFSATGALEGQHFRKTNKRVKLSEQNLDDCVVFPHQHKGCNGGNFEAAFQYVKESGGIDTERSYPYEGGVDDVCRFKKNAIGATDTGYVDLPSGSEEMLKQAVCTIGPVSVGIDASLHSFKFYNGTVYHDSECSSTDLNHAVLVVGYGTDPNGKAYWIVKNSWGQKWGIDGYVLMARNEDNACGIATSASYPLV